MSCASNNFGTCRYVPGRTPTCNNGGFYRHKIHPCLKKCHQLPDVPAKAGAPRLQPKRRCVNTRYRVTPATLRCST